MTRTKNLLKNIPQSKQHEMCVIWKFQCSPQRHNVIGKVIVDVPTI